MNPTSTVSQISIKATGVPVPGALDRQQHISGFDQEKYSRSHVLCVGAGGLISNVAGPLVRKGIGHLTILDHDEVEPSNLNRQHFYSCDIGQNKAIALIRNLQRECTYATKLTGYAISLETAIHNKIDLRSDVAVVGVDNSSARKTAAQLFRKMGIPVIFIAVSADADHGYVFIQGKEGPCIGCVLPDTANDAFYACPGTPSILDVLKLVGALATYAVDSVIVTRLRHWNYRALYLSSGEWDVATIVSQRRDCPICNVKSLTNNG